ncbi:MAG: hypothetical protein WDA15_10825 [Trueperaceae bacterium]
MSAAALTRTRYLTGTAVAVGLSVLLPVMVHLLPLSGHVPAGARLLPIFYAPLLGVLLGRPAAALTAALLAPLLNHLLTGMPAPSLLPTMTTELVLFSGLALLLAKRPHLAFLAPLAWLAAHYLAPSLLGALSALPGLARFGGATSSALPALLATAWPGMLVLAIIGWAAGRWGRR